MVKGAQPRGRFIPASLWVGPGTHITDRGAIAHVNDCLRTEDPVTLDQVQRYRLQPLDTEQIVAARAVEPRITAAMVTRFKRAVASQPLLIRIFEAWTARENARKR